MLARVARGVGRVALWVLALVGVLAIWALWSLAVWLKGWGEPVVSKPVPVVVPVQEAAPDSVPAVVACACSSGATCTGPQGGVYCVGGDGKKRYRKRE